MTDTIAVSEIVRADTFKVASFSEAARIASREALGTGVAWSVLDPFAGFFLVLPAVDAVELFPSSIVRTVEPTVSLDSAVMCHGSPLV